MSVLTDLIETVNGKELFFDEDKILYYTGEWEPVTICENAVEHLEEHFDNWEITIPHPSGDPQLDIDKKVSGKKYINHQFNSDYAEALKNL